MNRMESDPTSGRPLPEFIAGFVCDHCEGEGQIWESCGCNACEYDAMVHSRYIKCENCDGDGLLACTATPESEES